MALFTPQEALDSTIIRCEVVFSDVEMNNHMHYIFEVADKNGFNYYWKDSELDSGANKEIIKSRIYTHLINNINKKEINNTNSEEQLRRPTFKKIDNDIVGQNPDE